MNRWLVNLAHNQNSLEAVTHAKHLQNTTTTINRYQLFHPNIGELAQVLYAMSPDPFLRVAFGKGPAAFHKGLYTAKVQCKRSPQVFPSSFSSLCFQGEGRTGTSTYTRRGHYRACAQTGKHRLLKSDMWRLLTHSENRQLPDSESRRSVRSNGSCLPSLI